MLLILDRLGDRQFCKIKPLCVKPESDYAIRDRRIWKSQFSIYKICK